MDTISINIKFVNGSIATINYFANGNKKYSKEKIDIFSNGKILSLDNFRTLSTYGWPGLKRISNFIQDKGQSNCIKAFLNSIKNNQESPIYFDEIIHTSEICLEIEQSLNEI